MCGNTVAATKCVCNADGSDTCVNARSCVAYCDSPDAKRQLDQANALVLSCDPFLPNTCPGNLVCFSSNQCLQLTCDNSLGLVTRTCPGLCMPVDRKLTGAQLADSGDAITVALNAPAAALGVSCSSLFDADTAGRLGAGAWCVAKERSLEVTLGTGATVLPSQQLSLLDSQKLLVDKLQPDAAFSGSATLATCMDCQAPTAAISGPKVGAALTAPASILPQDSAAQDSVSASTHAVACCHVESGSV